MMTSDRNQGICYARAERTEPDTIRCAVCRLAWDRDDPQPPVCGRLVTLAPEREPFKSGLPADLR